MMNEKYKIRKMTSTNHDDNGFADPNSSYILEEAVAIVKELRSKNIQAELYPEEYATPKISEAQAWEIARKQYEEALLLKPNNYSSLTIREGSPIYYSFNCRDFEKEAAGMTPGYFTIMVDKLDGHIVTKEEFGKYRKLNYSF